MFRIGACKALVFFFLLFFFNHPATTEIYTLSLHDALPISFSWVRGSCEYSAYSNSGLQKSASKGQTSTQIPQYMHSAKSIAKRSRMLQVRARPPSLGATVSLCESI